MSKFDRRCCFNCAHHRDYHLTGSRAETLVCSIKAQKLITLDTHSYMGVDYDQRIAATTPPCDKWQIETNVPKGFEWKFAIQPRPRQLSLF